MQKRKTCQCGVDHGDIKIESRLPISVQHCGVQPRPIHSSARQNDNHHLTVPNVAVPVSRGNTSVSRAAVCSTHIVRIQLLTAFGVPGHLTQIALLPVALASGTEHELATILRKRLLS